MLLAGSNYLLANIVLEAVIMRRFVKLCEIAALISVIHASW